MIVIIIIIIYYRIQDYDKHAAVYVKHSKDCIRLQYFNKLQSFLKRDTRVGVI